MAKSSLQRLTIAVCFTLIAVLQVIGQARTVTGRVKIVGCETSKREKVTQFDV